MTERWEAHSPCPAPGPWPLFSPWPLALRVPCQVPAQAPVRVAAGARGATLLLWGVDIRDLVVTSEGEGGGRHQSA